MDTAFSRCDVYVQTKHVTFPLDGRRGMESGHSRHTRTYKGSQKSFHLNITKSCIFNTLYNEFDISYFIIPEVDETAIRVQKN